MAAITPLTSFPANGVTPAGGAGTIGRAGQTLNIGGNTVVAANGNITVSAGTTAIDASLGTGVTKTTTGLNTIGGDLLMAAGKIVGFGAPQALSGPGAINVTTLATNFTSTGAGDALTLANGTQAGQVKIVTHIVDGGSGVITPTTTSGFTTATLTNVRDWVAFLWTGAAWTVLMYSGATFT